MAGTARPEPHPASPPAGVRAGGRAPALLAEVATGIRGAPGALAEEVAAELAAVPPASDAGVQALVERGTVAVVAQLLDVLADPAGSLDGDTPEDVRAIVAALARTGEPPSELIRACRVAQHAVWREVMEQATRHAEPGPALVDVVELVSARLFARTDVVVDKLLTEWSAERDRAAGDTAARRAAVVHRLLAGQETGAHQAAAALDFPLDRTVCAAVLWDTGDGEPQAALAALQRPAEAIARAAGAAAPLTLPGDDGALWAWAGAPAPPDLGALAAAAEAALREGQGVALGMPAAGLAGFRVGHVEACEARRVAELAGREAGVVRYDEVEAVSLLAEDLERLARFVHRTLGDLAAPGEATTRLRRTLRAWLATGGSAPAAAVRLGVHKNTVLYRVHRADGLLPRPIDADRLRLELALAAAEELGLDTLHAAGPPRAAIAPRRAGRRRRAD